MQGRSSFNLLGWIAFLLCTTFFVQAEASSGQLETEAFSRLPMHSKAQLSPDGQRIAYVHSFLKPEVSVLSVYDSNTGKPSYLLQTDNVGMRLNWFQWANNRTLVGGISVDSFSNGVDITTRRLFAVDADKPGEGMRNLIKPRQSTYQWDHNAQFQDNVIDILPDDPDHILVAVDLDTANMPSVYKLNIYDRSKSRIMRGKRKVRDWMTDQQGQLRLAMALDYKKGKRTIYYLPDKGKWQTLFEYNALTDPDIEPIGFAADPNFLYYRAFQGDKKVLMKMDVAQGNSELVFKDDYYDFDGSLIYGGKDRGIIGITHVNSPTGRIYWDQEIDNFQKSLDHALPDSSNYLVGITADRKKYLLYTQSDTTPGAYYLGDREAQELTFVLEQYPELPRNAIAGHELVNYTARDGTQIEAYLTLPKQGGKPYPTIIHPHGGPGARDVAGFDYWTAYFSAKGYAVLRPNFRGSTGYGYQFANSQMHGWGLEMQDDLTDATYWMIEKGLADPKKLCIVGGSYGGYAAAMAAVKTPDLFQCAVSYAGVMDLKSLVRKSRKFLGRKFVKAQIGSDSDDLEARSPVYHVNKIKTPLLLIHGEEDRIVPVSHSQDMYEEMQEAGKQVRYVELEDGSHYLSIQRNRHLFFKEMDAFLSRYLD